MNYKLIAAFGVFMSFWCIFVAVFIPPAPIIVKIMLGMLSGLLLYFSGKLWYKEEEELIHKV